MREKRRFPRSTTRHPGRALLTGRAELDCTVRDLSPTGARLSFRHPAFLPKTFHLRFEAGEQRVTVVWQRGLHAGVRFHEPIRAPALRKRRLWPWS